MYICSSAEFDKVLLEDGCTNRMVEALDLFCQMVGCPYFSDKSFMLFLNKQDDLPTPPVILTRAPPPRSPCLMVFSTYLLLRARVCVCACACILCRSDLLEKKIQDNVRLKQYFPRYCGKPHDVEAAKDFILDMYVSRWLKQRKREGQESLTELYPHFTQATDTTNVATVVKCTKHIFSSGKLRAVGMI